MKNNTFKLNCISPILSGCCATLILIIVYIIKDIYPFGIRDISYYDMAQSFVPAYYQVYDILHGDKDLFWNWYIVGGSSTVDFISMFIFSPFTLFFYFVKRELILNSMSILLLIKTFFISFSMTLYVRRKFNESNYLFSIVSGIVYASSGYVVQYYTNFQFLDTVFLFPLIMIGVDLLIEHKKTGIFMLFLTASLVNNLYMSVLVCWYIIIYFFFYTLHMKKEAKIERTVLLGLSTLFSVLISSFIALPTVYTLLSSSRNNFGKSLNVVEYYTKLILEDNYSSQRYFMLFGSEILFALILHYILRKKFHCSLKYPTMRVLLLLILPIPFVVTNYLWHPGGYVDFPMRFGFMLTFTTICLFFSLLQNHLLKESNNIQTNRIMELFSISLVPLGIAYLFLFCSQFTELGIKDLSAYSSYKWLFLLLLCTYSFLLWLKNTRIKTFLICFLLIIQCFLGWYGFLAPEIEKEGDSKTDFIINSELLRKQYETEDLNVRYLNRMKDLSVSLNTNYPQIIGRSSISGWTWGVGQEFLNTKWYLGYGANYARSLDCGGTIFTDALFHITDVVSNTKLDSFIYTSDESFQIDNLYYVGTNKFVYPFGICVNSNDISIENDAFFNSIFDYQNALFRMITSVRDETLFHTLSMQDCVTKRNEIMNNGFFLNSFDIQIDEASTLYLSPSQNNEYIFYVNDTLVSIPDIENIDNYTYPGFFNNGLVNLGSYENQIVNVEILSNNNLLDNDCIFGIISHNALSDSIKIQKDIYQEINVTSNTLNITLDNTQNYSYLLIPIALNSGIKAQNGDISIPIIPAISGSLFVVPLNSGMNNITISYEPQGFKMGCVLSVLGLCFTVVFHLLKNILSPHWLLGKIMNICYYLLLIAFICIVYVLPIILTFYVKIIHKN